MPSSFRPSRFAPLAACFLVLAVLAVPAATRAQPTPIKIAVVDLDRVAANSSAGEDLQKELDAFRAEVKTGQDARGEKIRAIRAQAVEGANTLSQAKLSELQTELDNAQIELKRYLDDKQREGQKKQQEGLRAIELEMEPVFEAIRDEESYDLILNYVPGVVVMAGDRVDITQKVIDRMNAAAN